MQNAGAQLERLVQIMARLRAEGGCPWDREQNLASLRPYLVEEAFEVLDEMDRVSRGGSWQSLCEELGDLLFQIVFHAQLATELSEFQLADVCRAISDKLESRHPHVFGTEKVSGAEQVLSNWAKLKAEEKKRKTGKEGSVLDGVPTAAPALLRAERLTEKASRIGFDWPHLKDVRAKLDEELGELDEAVRGGKRAEIEHELGDVLFSLVNLARFLKIPAEDALRLASHRFTTRFGHIEKALKAEGVPFGQATLAQMEQHWGAAKQVEKSLPPPRTLPQASLSRLYWPVADIAAQRRCWDALAPLLRWEVLPGSDREVRYSDRQLILAFEAQAGALPSSGEFTFSAPSREAVKHLQGALEQVPGVRRLSVLDAEAGLVFEDPSGLRWRYAPPFPQAL